MSGTSIDGIDAALVEFDGPDIRLQAFHYQAFPADLRERIHNISQAGQAVLLKDYGHLDSCLGNCFAEAAITVLGKSQLNATEISAIGSHGQTVYHAPDGHEGFSLQIGDPNRIAQLTGITTIADFRRRDIAAGGQGAPLVPAFHQAVFNPDLGFKLILNIGGIANISILNGKQVIGFDTGPGNTLMDLWCQQHTGSSYDKNGAWAASGQTNFALLKNMKADDYFRTPPPKSTGKEYFSTAWLNHHLASFPELKPADVQATLCQLTADTIADAIKSHASHAEKLLVCGGGTHNHSLIERIKAQLEIAVESTAILGIDPDHVEAIAFAWLARQTLLSLPGNLPEVTGAEQPVILGGIYPASP